jgi:hypothetical protein
MSKTLELLKQHPETTKLIQAWYLDKMLESFKDESVPEDFKEMMRATPIDNDKISKMIDGAPRLLFDFFDEHELYVEVLVNYKDKPSIFTYTVIADGDVVSQPTKYNSRKEAEYVAIEEAFKLLNDKILNSDL